MEMEWIGAFRGSLFEGIGGSLRHESLQPLNS
jgi:hypothetical protein